MDMADRASIENVIRDAYAARMTKDLDAIMRIFTPDAAFHLVGSPAVFAGAMRFKGEANLRAGIGALIASFDFLEQRLITSVIEGNKAAMHWGLRFRHNPTGEIHETELFDLWTIEGGRVVSLVQFCDTALAAQLTARAISVA
jgi:ketosteroid isomerase-like protein